MRLAPPEMPWSCCCSCSRCLDRKQSRRGIMLYDPVCLWNVTMVDWHLLGPRETCPFSSLKVKTIERAEFMHEWLSSKGITEWVSGWPEMTWNEMEWTWINKSMDEWVSEMSWDELRWDETRWVKEGMNEWRNQSETIEQNSKRTLEGLYQPAVQVIVLGFSTMMYIVEPKDNISSLRLGWQTWQTSKPHNYGLSWAWSVLPVRPRDVMNHWCCSLYMMLLNKGEARGPHVFFWVPGKELGDPSRLPPKMKFPSAWIPSMLHLFHCISLSLRETPLEKSFAGWLVLNVVLHTVFQKRLELFLRTTAIYICTVTVTTVGYGDVTPTTNSGRALAGILCFISVLFMAMPISLLGNVSRKRYAAGAGQTKKGHVR